MGGRREVSILPHRPVTSSDLKQERLCFCESVSTFLQLVAAPGLGRRDGFCFCLSPPVVPSARISFTDGFLSFCSFVPIALICSFEASDALAIEIAFSNVSLL